MTVSNEDPFPLAIAANRTVCSRAVWEIRFAARTTKLEWLGSSLRTGI